MTVQEQKINRDVLQKTMQMLEQHFATQVEINSIQFYEVIGCFHAASYGKTSMYEALLKKIHGNVEALQEDLDFTRTDLLEKLHAANKKLHLPVTTECIKEANSLIESLLTPGPFTVLTHGDICPDNVFDHEDTPDLQLIA